MIEDFISKFRAKTYKVNKTSYKLFNFYLRLYGTKVTVERLVIKKIEGNEISLPPRDQMIGTIYGKVSTNDSRDNSEVERVDKFECKLIIPDTDPAKFYNKSLDNITIYHNENILDLGDKITYKRLDRMFELKVIDMNTYDEILFEYILIGMKDYAVTN